MDENYVYSVDTVNSHTKQDYTTQAGSAGAVFEAFRAKGTTARAWAISRGWRPASVYKVIREWVEHPVRCGRMPLGGINRAIIVDLRETLGTDLIKVSGDIHPELERAA